MADEASSSSTRPALPWLLTAAALLLLGCSSGEPPMNAAPAQPAPLPPAGSLNVLLLTVDDMSWDSIGAYGAQLPGLTPHIDALAASGVRFEHAYVTSPICQPSRSAWMTGLYPPASGAIGFLPVRAGVPTLAEVLRAAGWRVGILAKNTHTPPQEPGAWDLSVPPARLGAGRDPAAFAQYTREFVVESRATGRPFFLNVNLQDPHRPWPGGKPAWWYRFNPQGEFPPLPTAFVDPANVPVPGYLPDLPEIRGELAQYYTAVHRADAGVGAVMAVLDELGLRDSTLVIFLSDNGISMPFAKQTHYMAGTRSAMLVRWPGHAEPGRVEHAATPAGIDVMPTILQATGVASPARQDGRSLVAVIEGREGGTIEAGAYTYLDRVDMKLPVIPRFELDFPTRGLQTPERLYVWNAWAGRRLISEPGTTPSFKAMKRAAALDPAVAARVEFFLRRTPEEFCDLQRDPDCLHNLAGDPAYATELAIYRDRMAAHLAREQDPLADAYHDFLGITPLPSG